jgi:hypothetical protein
MLAQECLKRSFDQAAAVDQLDLEYESGEVDRILILLQAKDQDGE